MSKFDIRSNTSRRVILSVALSISFAFSFSPKAFAAWGGWENLGGIILEDPECVSWGSNRIDCFARGQNRAMYHRWWNGGSWGGWENLGGIILEEPECVSWGSNRIDCFARGQNRSMYHRWWNGSNWGGWENLGGVILEEPSCVSWGPDRIDCFARGQNRAMYHRWWNGIRWGGWENLGGVILEEPECVSWGPNRIDCFARGENRAMYHRWWNGSRWGGWENLGGVLTSRPECVSWGPNRLDCFARGQNGAMYHRWWNGSGWHGWENLGGFILEEPECVSWGPNRIDCFARGGNRSMYHRWWNGSQWGGWENLGGIILEEPECVSWGPSRLDCFARGQNRAMYHRWWPCPSCGITNRSLTVRRHNGTSLTNADVDSILSDGSTVLQTNNGSGDVACRVAMVRSGNVGVFSTGDGSLDTSAELSAIFNLSGNVKVVDDVNYCANTFNTSYIGCGQTPGSSFITERFTASQEGILWAHEFGHNQGLPHRNTTTNNVMYFSIGSNRQRVNQSECNSFRGSSGAVADTSGMQSPASSEMGVLEVSTSADDSADIMPANNQSMPANTAPMPENAGTMPDNEEAMPDNPAVSQQSSATMESSSAGADGPMSVEEFVSQIYFEGLPLAKAAKYGEQDVGILISMLKDPAQTAYHENIALTLGMIGSPRAVDALISYIDKPSDTMMSRRAYKGRVGAVIGLGYLVNQTGSEKALSYLVESASPAGWKQREGNIVAPKLSVSETVRDLSKYSIISLGLSGNAKAAEHLESMRSQGRLGARGTFESEVKDVVAQSLKEHEKISKDGLLNYYEPSK